MVIARIQAISLCSDQQTFLEIRVNRNNLELLTQLTKDSFHSEDFQRQFAMLDEAMKGTVATYLGGLPGIFFVFCFKKCFFFFFNEIDTTLNMQF